MRYLPSKVLLLALMSIALTTVAEAADTPVRVVVTNVVKQNGVLLAGVYAEPETWLSGTTVASRDVPVAGNVRDGTVTFEMLLPPGSYALSVLQDLNGNRKLDTNFIGIPKEPSGSSNDAKATFSAPKFRDAVFTVGAEPIELRIRLN
jgi:uncharacterized protein (DUF2141 family)